VNPALAKEASPSSPSEEELKRQGCFLRLWQIGSAFRWKSYGTDGCDVSRSASRHEDPHWGILRWSRVRGKQSCPRR